MSLPRELPCGPRTRVLIVGLAILAVATALSACGADGKAAAVDESPTASPPEILTLDREALASMTIAEILRSEEQFSRFRELVERVETPIADSVLAVWDWPPEQLGDSRSGVTVFVPLNEAFERLDRAVLAIIEDSDTDNELLYTLFGHHYVHRLYPSDEFAVGDQSTWRVSFSGPVQLTVSPPTFGGHRIIETDIRATNGMIHVIDGVVVPDLLRQAARERS